MLVHAPACAGRFQIATTFTFAVTAHHMPLQVFLCADLWKDACTLKSAYHDSAGVTEDFIRNGLHNALCTLGMSQESPDITKWPYHVVVNPELQQVGANAI